MISLCITTYNRVDLLLQSFPQVINDDRISEIIIVDDHSDLGIFNKIDFQVREMPKVRLCRNDENIGMSRNKAKAIGLAENEWCIILDSDNVIDSSYLDAIDKIHPDLNETTIYCPQFAKPQFDYRKYAGMTITSDNVGRVMAKPMGECLFNTCNYLVNRDQYLNVYDHNPEMKGTDTIWFNYLWLRAGNSFFVVPEMEYAHKVHEGSGFMADVEYNMQMAKKVKQLITTLR